MAGHILRRLDDLPARPDVIASLDDSERLMGLDCVMSLYRGIPLQSVLSNTSSKKVAKIDADWNRMLREMNGWYDRAFAPLRLAAYDGRAQAVAAYEKKINAFARRAGNSASLPVRIMLLTYGGRIARRARTEAVSNALIAMLIPSLAKVSELQDRVRTWCDVERLVLALAAWRAKNGNWPAKLDELVPSLMKEIPIDPFSGKALIYKPTAAGYVLYSVGSNLQDDGGPSGPEDEDKSADQVSDDIGARVGPAKGDT